MKTSAVILILVWTGKLLTAVWILSKSNQNVADALVWDYSLWWLYTSLNDDLVFFLSPASCHTVWKLWTGWMEFSVPKASWQEMSGRNLHHQRQRHRQGFVGKFLCNGSSLSGLAASFCLQFQTTWRSKSGQPEGWHLCWWEALDPLFVWGLME